MRARFAGKVTLSDLDPPNGYQITRRRQGGAAGFAKGGATVQLADDGGGTILSYTVEAQIGGKLAQIGSRLIDGDRAQDGRGFLREFAPRSARAAARGASRRGCPKLAPSRRAGAAPHAASSRRPAPAAAAPLGQRSSRRLVGGASLLSSSLAA